MGSDQGTQQVIGSAKAEGERQAEPAIALPGAPRRIAILRALFLGDLLCTTPAFRALRRRFPQAEITLIGLPWASDLVDRLPSLDRLACFPGYPGIIEVPYEADRTAAFLTAARARRYDLALQMHGDGNLSNGFVADLGAAVSLGYRRGPDDRLMASLLYDRGEHEVLRWLRLVALLGASPDDSRLECPTTPADRARATSLLGASTQLRPLIGLHPGAKDPARRWPAERFAALADALAERHGARIVLTGGASERDVTAAVRQAMRAPAQDLAGETDLGSFAAVVGLFDLLVTNDTGAWHLAVAVDTPSVAVIGPGNPDGWEPLDRTRHWVVDARRLAGQGMDPETALRQLPMAPVYAACQEALAGKLPVAEAREGTMR